MSLELTVFYNWWTNRRKQVKSLASSRNRTDILLSQGALTTGVSMRTETQRTTVCDVITTVVGTGGGAVVGGLGRTTAIKIIHEKNNFH